MLLGSIYNEGEIDLPCEFEPLFDMDKGEIQEEQSGLREYFKMFGEKLPEAFSRFLADFNGSGAEVGFFEEEGDLCGGCF